MRKILITGLVLSGLLMTGCASMVGENYSDHVVVLSSETHNNSGWKTGALIGAGIGAATGGGKSSSSKLGRAAVGASVGGALQKGATRNNTQTKAVGFDRNGDLHNLMYREPLAPGQCMLLEKKGVMVSVSRAAPINCSWFR